MLLLDQVAARSGAFLLGPLSLEMGAGECHALLGPSGAGKSTLLELLVGFRHPEAGRMLMNGRVLDQLPVERRGIGYLPQRLALFPHLTVHENILYGIRCRRRPDPADLSRVQSLVAALGLTQLSERRPEALSGGERQRVALARALAPAPELLILDEPFSALNETLRQQLWELLQSLQGEYRVATLMVTHDLEEAYFLGKQLHILIDGGLHQSGDQSGVFHRPATLAAAHLLGHRNVFAARIASHEQETGHTLLDWDGKLIRAGLRSDLSVGASVHWLIPTGYILIEPPERQGGNVRENLVDGRLSHCFFLGNTMQARLVPEHGAASFFHLEFSTHDARHAGLADGKTLTVSMHASDIHLIPDS